MKRDFAHVLDLINQRRHFLTFVYGDEGGRLIASDEKLKDLYLKAETFIVRRRLPCKYPLEDWTGME
jgi:hypothetical protein